MSDMIPATRTQAWELQCPACDGIHWINGSRGGMSVNITCVTCQAKWNWLVGHDLLQPLNEIAEKVKEEQPSTPG